MATLLHFLKILGITFAIAYAIFNLICVILCPDIAQNKKRTMIGWFIFPLVFFGLSWIPLIIIVRLKPKEKKQLDF